MSLSVTSCKKEELKPELIIGKNYVEIAGEGGIINIDYNIENPIDGLLLRNEYDAEWITDVSMSSKEITIRIAPNKGKDSRESEIEFIYGDSDETLKIKQFSQNEIPDKTPFEVDIKELSETNVIFDITPADKAMTYTVLSISKKMNDEISDDEVLFDEIISVYEEQAYSNGMSLEDFIKKSNMLVKGDIKSGIISQLKPDTDYVLLTFGMNTSGELLSSIVRTPFHTEPVEFIEISFGFDFEIDGPDVLMTVTPSVEDTPYYAGVIKKSEYNENLVAETAQQDINMLITLLTGLGGMSFEDALNKILVKGIYEYEIELDADTEYMAYAIAVNPSGLVCSTSSVEEFKTGDVEMSDNVIDLELSYINLDRVDYSIKTSNNDQYFFTIKDKSQYEGLNDQEILNILSSAVFSWDLYSGDQNGTYEYLSPGVEYYAFIFGYHGGKVTSEMQKYEFTTLTTPEDPSSFTITTSIDEISMTSATISIKGDPHTVLYYWDICPASYTEEDMKSALDSYLDELTATSEFYSSREIFFKVNGSRHTASFTYDNLIEGTEYKPFAVAINENTWEYATDFIFGETFSTKERVISDATVTARYDKYFDIDQLAEEFGGDYESFKGQNRYYLRVDVETTGNVVKTYTAALRGNLTDSKSTSDAMLIQDLVKNNMGLTDKVCEFALMYDTDVTIVSVAEDSEGNYSNVFRGLVNYSKDGVSDISEFEPVKSPARVLSRTSTIDNKTYQQMKKILSSSDYKKLTESVKTKQAKSNKYLIHNPDITNTPKTNPEIIYYSPKN